MGTLTAAVRFYPSRTGAFYLTGGLGVAKLDLVRIPGYGSGYGNGIAALLGVGYDIRVRKSLSITPFWNAIGGLFAGPSANFEQLGLGVTWH